MSPTRHQKTTKGRRCQAGCAVVHACDFMRGRCARVLGQTAGFTLTEALTTVIIVGLVTSILAGGIGLASKQYTQQVSSSEAQMLYSSLQKILDTELRFVEKFEYDPAGKVVSFESKHYMAQQSPSDPSVMERTTKLSTVTRLPGDVMLVREPSEPGQLAMASGLGTDMANNPLLPNAAYNYGLQASVKTFTYDKGKNFFTLRLVISRPDGETDDGQVLIDETFTVRPLNYSAVGTGSSSGEGSGSGGSNTGEGGSGPGDNGEGGSTTLKVPIDNNNTIQVPTSEWGVISAGTAGIGDVVRSETGEVYYVVNNSIPAGDLIIDGGGNSSHLISVKMNADGNPVVRPANEISNKNPAEQGTLCYVDGTLYIATKTVNNAPKKDDGNWQVVTMKSTG